METFERSIQDGDQGALERDESKMRGEHSKSQRETSSRNDGGGSLSMSGGSDCSKSRSRTDRSDKRKESLGETGGTEQREESGSWRRKQQWQAERRASLMRGAEEDWLLQGDDKQKDWEPAKSPIAMEVDEKEVCENQTAGRRGGRGRTAGRNKGQRNPPKLSQKTTQAGGDGGQNRGGQASRGRGRERGRGGGEWHGLKAKRTGTSKERKAVAQTRPSERWGEALLSSPVIGAGTLPSSGPMAFVSATRTIGRGMGADGERKNPKNQDRREEESSGRSSDREEDTSENGNSSSDSSSEDSSTGEGNSSSEDSSSVPAMAPTTEWSVPTGGSERETT